MPKPTGFFKLLSSNGAEPYSLSPFQNVILANTEATEPGTVTDAKLGSF